MIRFSFVAFILVFFSGCRNAAHNPFVITPPTFRQSWNPYPKENPIPCEDLVDPFVCTERTDGEPMNLAALIELALSNSYQARVTWADTHIAASLYGASLSVYYPEISFTGYVEAIRESNYFGSNNLPFLPGINLIEIDEFREYGPQFSLSYLIFDWGARGEESEFFRQRVWHANWSHNRQIQTVIQQVIIDYYDLLAKTEQVSASEATLYDARTVLDATEKKYRMGIDDISDTLIAETQVSKQVIGTLQAEKDRETAKTKLTADLSIPANTKICIATNFELPPSFVSCALGTSSKDNRTDCLSETCGLKECIIQALLNRPDLFAAYSKVKSTEAGVKYTIKDQYPKFYLDASGAKRYFENGLSRGVDYGMKVNVEIPIFQGFWYENRIREAKSLLQHARGQFLELENSILKDVVTYYQEFEIAIKNLKASESYLSTATRSYESTFSQFKAGTKDITTVVNSLTSLAEARASLVEAKNAWFSALINLAYATGVLADPKRNCGGNFS